MHEPVILHATFTAREGETDRVAELVRDYAHLVRAEPGNVAFEATQRADVPEAFFIYEVYENELAFSEHLNAPKGRIFNDKLAPLIVEPESNLTFLRRVT
jgi:quinol monooxygenase YgiN